MMFCHFLSHIISQCQTLTCVPRNPIWQAWCWVSNWSRNTYARWTICIGIRMWMRRRHRESHKDAHTAHVTTTLGRMYLSCWLAKPTNAIFLIVLSSVISEVRRLKCYCCHRFSYSDDASKSTLQRIVVIVQSKWNWLVGPHSKTFVYISCVCRA